MINCDYTFHSSKILSAQKQNNKVDKVMRGRRQTRFEPHMPNFIVASDWEWGVEAVLRGKELLGKKGNALDAVETAIRAVEDNPNVDSVGTGGLPNADGIAELDASIMDGTNMRAGGVTGLRMTKNAISVARKVMELTPHVLISGQGATEFARRCGFPEYDPLTPEAREKWKKLRDAIFTPETDELSKKAFRETGVGPGYDSLKSVQLLAESLRKVYGKTHDTVGVLATDMGKHIVAGTSTSGWAMRFPGRVADSSVIGAGNYANRKAAASSTGVGETAIKHCITKSICDLVEDGMPPKEACETALLKMLSRERFDHIIGVFCIDVDCNVGGACTQEGFQYEYMTSTDTEPVIVRPKPVRP
jgi:isoaspartyl peptidase/L-asparaginase-like protein (Ntn-hydrolase superfamily)